MECGDAIDGTNLLSEMSNTFYYAIWCVYDRRGLVQIMGVVKYHGDFVFNNSMINTYSPN